jgi:type I restriction enzyme S subunit
MATGPFGSSIGTKTFRDHGVPVLRGSNLSADVGVRLIDDGLVFIEPALAAQFSRSVATDGDLVFTCWGTVNQVGLIDHRARHRRYIVSNKQMKFTADPRKALPLFLYYWFSSPAGQADILSGSIGSSVPGFNLGQLRKMQVPLPPLGEQQAIASILGALDDKIELNQRMNETLEAMARAIFQDWFVAFGPTRAKLEGRPPYLAPDLWALFPDRLDADGKPQGWSTQPLSAFMSFRGGSQPSADEFVREPRPGFIRLLQIRDFDTDAHITFVPCTSRLRLVDEDDICIGRYGSGTGEAKDSLGRLCRGLAGAINVALVHVTPAFNCREWLATFIGSGLFRTAISGGSARAVQAGFRQEDLDFLKVTRAPNEIHAAFEEVGTLVWVQKKAAARENETLAATRDLLLPRLMSGELRVKDAERAVEAAV